MQIIYHTGLKEFVDKPVNLEFLQKLVGGYVETLRIDTKRFIAFNEDGKLMNLPFNTEATILAHDHRLIRQDDYIVGNAVVMLVDELE